MHMAIQTSHIQQQQQANLNLNMPSSGAQGLNSLTAAQQQQQQHSQQSRKVNQQADLVASSANQRASTPKAIRGTNTAGSNQQQQHRQPKSTPPTNAAVNVAQQQQQQQQSVNSNQNLLQSQQEHLHNMQQQYSQLSGQHHHQQNMHIDYITSIPPNIQNYSSNATNSYDIVSMPTVIPQRMTISNATHSLSSPHQRSLDQSSPSACAVNNFYMQNNLTANEASSSRVPVPASSAATNSNGSGGGVGVIHISPDPSASSSSGNGDSQLAQDNVSESSSSNAGTTPTQQVGNLCSLSKLQQLTNGLDIQQPCSNTSPAGQVNLTPPPHHPVSHNSMTPPPHLLVTQNRSLGTPPNMLQPQINPLQYHKYYSSNMNIAPIATSQNVNRNARNTASAPVQHIAVSSVTTSSTTSRTTNVHISPNLMPPYGAINGYRMTTPQAAATPTYAAGGDYSNSQIPMQMGVMNMQSQYPDACAIQRAQQNSMYSTYPPPYLSLNGAMRR